MDTEQPSPLAPVVDIFSPYRMNLRREQVRLETALRDTEDPITPRKKTIVTSRDRVGNIFLPHLMEFRRAVCDLDVARRALELAGRQYVTPQIMQAFVETTEAQVGWHPQDGWYALLPNVPEVLIEPNAVSKRARWFSRQAAAAMNLLSPPIQAQEEGREDKNAAADARVTAASPARQAPADTSSFLPNTRPVLWLVPKLTVLCN